MSFHFYQGPELLKQPVCEDQVVSQFKCSTWFIQTVEVKIIWYLDVFSYAVILPLLGYKVRKTSIHPKVGQVCGRRSKTDSESE